MIMKKVAYLGLLTSFALILSYVEYIFPIPVPFPGFKLGLANFAVLISLYLFGCKEAALVNLARILLAALLFGSVYSFVYAFCGACLSLTVESLLYKKKCFSEIGISVIGGVFHNVGQLIFAVIVTKSTAIMLYSPVLIAAGILTGLLIGILAKIVIPRIKKLVKTES